MALAARSLARELSSLACDLLWLASLLRPDRRTETPEVELVTCFRAPGAQHEEEPWQTEAVPFDTGWVMLPTPPCAQNEKSRETSLRACV